MFKLFGTDGIRGEANRPPMNGPTALEIGRSVAGYFGSRHNCDSIILGKDTRISGDMLENAIAAGVCAAGLDVLQAGVVPTPAVAYLVKQREHAAGIVISASHNPWYDNGIKLFSHEGRKLTEQVETEIEDLIAQSAEQQEKGGGRLTGRVRPIPAAADAYIDFLCGSVTGVLFDGLSVAIDCAHGAASAIAPAVFEKLGAAVTVLNAAPDGRNINRDCGSEHPGDLIQTVKRVNADIGLAFDGDADRLIAVDEKGSVIAGDQLIAICAAHYKAKQLLENNCVVTTVMSNIGLTRALAKLDVTHVVSGVGDRFVFEKMLDSGAVIGGENSGHLIFRDRHTTGDGILSALKLLDVMRQRSAPLSALAGIMDVFPQALMAVNVKHKPDLEALPEVLRVIADVESRLGDRGRVLVRYSGTQPICRVMVEGPEQSVTEDYCRKICETVRACIGV